ncbi:signal peptidase II [Jannaschia sp. Os4]|uniref:signal peptidase II n=1 Tax=Jannaschia sp. Os4 TaxID=2807617 RepID=UPI00193A207B|nr:signal peptidase II [Jannaschia sp. Os4]MBM2574802.1 signal peptidase II [Jannaschia sp. Os4]
MARLWIAAAAAFALDQLSKLVVVHGLNLDRVKEIEVFPPYLVFMMGWNTGINFGLGAGGPEVMRWVLTGLAVVISLALIVWARRLPPLAQVSAGLVVGGALANALDRVIYGAVADFLNMSCCGIDNPFAFNLADVFIFAGAFGLILWGERKTA